MRTTRLLCHLDIQSPVADNDYTNYDDVYIGQSVNVCKRVHNHFNGKGNGDAYANVRNGKYAYVQFQRCQKSKMNALEKRLIGSVPEVGVTT